MNLLDVVKKLFRRWYILLAGVILAGAGALGVWTQVPPRYERTSTQVLLPGKESLPQDGHNPYLYLGGITLAADVVVRAVGSENVAKEIETDYPGAEIEVSRDGTTAGPVILITVSATNDDEAGTVLRFLNVRTEEVLSELQRNEGIPLAERMTVVTVTTDEQGVVRERTRLILSVAAAAGIFGLSLAVAALVEGISSRRRRRAMHAEAGHAASVDDPPSRAAATEPDAAVAAANVADAVMGVETAGSVGAAEGTVGLDAAEADSDVQSAQPDGDVGDVAGGSTEEVACFEGDAHSPAEALNGGEIDSHGTAHPPGAQARPRESQTTRPCREDQMLEVT